jgi:DNA-binding response OmpR family regulator
VRILIVEDEPKMATLIRRGLMEEGHRVDVAHRSVDALFMARDSNYDAIVLDVMLPELDGLVVCRRLRECGIRTPVLMVTARDTFDDQAAAADSGADDYLTKPFAFSEFLARLEALRGVRRQ